MHSVVNQHRFINSSLDTLVQNLDEGSTEVRAAVASTIGTTDPALVEAERSSLASQFASIRDTAAKEPSHRDVDYVSRFHLVGLFQSVLSKVFSSIPSLQGYGDRNPIWVVTLIEQGVFALGNFFKQVHEDVQGQKEPLISSILKEWKNLRFERAPYPAGTPQVIKLSPKATIALLADWGGDNPAAHRIAGVVRKQQPLLAIHLGDIYYGGVKTECEAFLQLWPFQTNTRYPELGVPPGTSYALNGNHEMYSGGEAYFNIVLKAFGQPQPFFCLENDFWRIIGLDTAYAGGRLQPAGPDDPISAQWNWLIGLLRSRDKKKNILLTHHQPVSAHHDEFQDSAGLRKDVADLLATEGIAADAIFGWFFGHEHRCALYRDTETSFNARLIGNGCIPHEVQTEKESDPGCTPVDYFNKRQTAPGSGAAVSMFAKLSFMDPSPELLIEYVDEDYEVWGSEVWDAQKGRLGGAKFQETDFDDKLAGKN
jgi:hypothetical protein